MKPTRRHLLALLAGGLATPVIARAQSMSRVTAYAFSFKAINGGDIRLADYAGKPILVVNTASLCGYTPQYAGLQDLWKRLHERGLMIIGVPANDFGGQEPGGPQEILHAAQQDYGVTFPLAAKVEVKGSDMHPFFRWAAAERPLDTPRWNFHKYLIGPDGQLAGTWPTPVRPGDPAITAEIETALGKAATTD